MADTALHDDFGEKIGGAKKDLWKERGLITGDLDGMNDREAEKFVKKDNVWKKPDYEAMIADGMPVDVAYFIKTFRDSIGTAPVFLRVDDTPEKRLSRQKQYIETVREFRAAAESITSKTDAMNAFNIVLARGGYIELDGRRYSPTGRGMDNPVITNKLVNALYMPSEVTYERKITVKAARAGFGIPKEQKIPRGYEVRYNSRKETYYVTKGRFILADDMKSRDDALSWARDYAKDKGRNGKQRFVPAQLEHIHRDGPDYRSTADVSGQDYLDAFGFKGGEFGNWMSQNDRQASLNYGFDALKDLAAALKISGSDISYGGELSIAFGARGGGNAVAHYEPLRQVINLTKMRGAGSLAHEWWHGLDDFMGRKMGAGGFLSEHPAKSSLFAKLVDTMKYRPETKDEADARTEKQSMRMKDNAGKWLDSAMVYALKRYGDDTALPKYENLKSDFLAGTEGSVTHLNDLKKSVSGRGIPKDERDRLLIFEGMLRAEGEQKEVSIGKANTEYYRNSKAMGGSFEKDGSYWDSNCEMTARAFATYVMDRLPHESDYLIGHAESAISITQDKDGNTTVIKAYPQGDERTRINAVFDEIVADLKLQKHFTHEDRPEPLTRAPQEMRQGQLSFMDVMSEAGTKPSVLGQISATKTAPAPDIPKEQNRKTEAVR